MFSGAMTALVTPMRDGQVDDRKLREFVEWQLSEGIRGLVPCGTTGETPTLSLEEQSLVMRTVVEQTRGRVPVIGGAGANATAKAIEQSKLAKEAGVDALLHVTPYYNKPPQTGLVAHYRAIADAVNLPIVAYNVPGRTGCDLLPATLAQLAEIPTVVAVKEATGSVARAQQVIATCPENFAVISGDDATCMAVAAIGGAGVISVTANVTPRWMTDMIAAAQSGNLDQARALLYKQLRLIELMFIQCNPIPVKAAVALKGFCRNEVRQPLLPLSGEPLEKLESEMMGLGLLS